MDTPSLKSAFEHLILWCKCGARLEQKDLLHRVREAEEEFRAQHVGALCEVSKYGERKPMSPEEARAYRENIERNGYP